jgi:prophage antirepressor-like protein
MNHPLTFQTVEFKVIDHKGQTWLRAADIAQALGYSRTDKVSRIYRTHSNEFTSEMTAVVELSDPEHLKGVPGLTRNARIFSLRGAYLLGMFARTPKAEAFRRWVLDVLEGVTRAPATLYARLIEAQRKEAESFADASCHAKALRQRQKIKPKLNDEIDKANAALQLALPLEGGAA